MYTPTAEETRNYFAQKLAFTTGPSEVEGLLKRGEPVTLVDVRYPADFRKGHIPGAVNLPKGRWHTLKGLAKDRRTIVYCYSQTCHLAAEAAVEFASQGYSVIEMEGGFDAWQKYGFNVEAAS
jgi:rhodanese-related sulfurtransferase